MDDFEVVLAEFQNRLAVSRVVQAHMDKLAKRKHLKAIDFTLGLVKRLTAMGEKLPGNSNQEVIKRLMQMRKLSQKGIDLSTIIENKELLSGRGMEILKLLEKKEAQVSVSDKDLSEFVKPFPNNSAAAVEEQAATFAKAIMAATNAKTRQEVEDLVVKDKEFFDLAFAAVTPMLQKAKAAADSTIGGSAQGKYESRIKKADSTFGKQTRENVEPFIYFKDLVGCRVVTPTIPNMAEVANATQNSSLKVIQKKNFYLQNKGYNAINYVLSLQGAVIEFQLKTDANALEAAISHDLIYAPEKAIIDLSSSDKSLVGKVIDVSTQLSMRDWAEAFGIAMKTAVKRHLIG